MKGDNLRKENYGIPVGFRIKKIGSCSRSGRKFEYSMEYKFIESENTRIKLKRGDIVKCSDGFIPEREINQFAVVLDRYRLIKYKVTNIFTDYAAVIMIITGPSKGKIIRVAGHLLSHLKTEE